jgi:CRP-like cAMP-binding protein
MRVADALHYVISSSLPGVSPRAEKPSTMTQGCHIRTLAADGTLLIKGDHARALFGVVSGEIELRFLAPSGDMSLVELVTPGKFFGLSSFLIERSSDLDAIALKPSALLVISKPAFLRMSKRLPGFTFAMLKELASRHSNLLELLNTSRHRNAACRLADAIDRFARSGRLGDRLASPDGQFLRATQSELAAASSLSRQTVNEILAHWGRCGWVSTAYGGVLLISPEKLRRI